MGRKEGLEPGREEGQEEWAGGRGLDRVPYVLNCNILEVLGVQLLTLPFNPD